MAHFHAGWDHFSPEAGTVEKMNCPVCGDEMKVTRGVNGPTGTIEAMAGMRHLHDSFSCLNFDKPWHIQVIRMREYRRKLPSKRLREIIEQEIMEVLASRQHTIEDCPGI